MYSYIYKECHMSADIWSNMGSLKEIYIKFMNLEHLSLKKLILGFLTLQYTILKSCTSDRVTRGVGVIQVWFL